MSTGEALLTSVICIPISSAAIGYLAGKKNERGRDIIVLVSCFAVLLCNIILAATYSDMRFSPTFSGSLQLRFAVDGFRVVMGCLAGLLWLVTTVFSFEYFSHSRNVNRYWLFNMLTFGAAMGLFYSADFYTAFIFFEMLSLTSYPMVALR